MTALRFQTGDDIRCPWPPFWGHLNKDEKKKKNGQSLND